MLALPIYLRGNTYYLHTRVAGKQLKRSLSTSDRRTAIIRASEWLRCIAMVDISKFKDIDFSKVKEYELDLQRGIMKADSPDDHARMLEAIQMMKGMQVAPPPATPASAPANTTQTAQQGMTIKGLLEKFFLMQPRKHTQSTVQAYTATVEEYIKHLGNNYLTAIRKVEVIAFKEALIKKNIASRTIDNNTGNLHAIFSFAIDHGYYFGDNPAAGLKILTKNDRRKTAHAIFTMEEIQKIIAPEVMRVELRRDPDYFWCLTLCLLTGCRISEVTSLTAQQVKQTERGVYYLDITDSKTIAGIRKVPIPIEMMNDGFKDFIHGKTKLFKYKERLGKGSGNAVSQKFKRQMKATGVVRDKLVFHSLRKFLNTELSYDGVGMEARCQLLGHEIGNVNTEFYLEKFWIEKLYEQVHPTQLRIINATTLFQASCLKASADSKTGVPPESQKVSV